jgi:cytochrome c553
MRKSLHLSFTVAALSLIFGPFNANGGPLDSPGAQKALVCSACHGFGGNSPGNSVPTLAGMTPGYFKKAINDYAKGRRPSPEMEPYSKYVLQAGLDEVAAYFAAQKKQPPKIKADPKSAKRAAALATQCVACHGPRGEGDAERAFPALSGQPPGYLRAQLAIFKEDKRKLEDAALAETKKQLLKPLSDSDLADLAAYFSTLK